MNYHTTVDSFNIKPLLTVDSELSVVFDKDSVNNQWLKTFLSWNKWNVKLPSENLKKI